MVIKDIKYWLEEPDLKTPKHDALVLWGMTHAEELIKDFVPEENKGYVIIDTKTETGSPYAGYIDIEIRARIKLPTPDQKDIYSQDYIFYIEIKPKINSFGDIMRQINFYRNNRNSGDSWDKYNIYIILTNSISLELKSAFRTQGIYIYEHKQEENNGNTNR